MTREAPIHPEENIELVDSLIKEASAAREKVSQRGIQVLDHNWSKNFPAEAAQAVAKVLAALYVRHAVHDNLSKFTEEIATDRAFVWVIKKDGDVVGCSCMLDCGNGALEVARSGIIPGTDAHGAGKIPMLERMALWLSSPKLQNRFDRIEGTIRMAADSDIPGGLPTQVINFQKCKFGLFSIEHLFHHGTPMRQEPFGVISKFKSPEELFKQNLGQELVIDPSVAEQKELLDSLISFNSLAIQTRIASSANRNDAPVLFSSQTIGDHTTLLAPNTTGLPLEQAVGQAMIRTWFTELTIPVNSEPECALAVQQKAADLGFKICGFSPKWDAKHLTENGWEETHLGLALKLGLKRPNTPRTRVQPSLVLGSDLVNEIAKLDRI